VPNNVSGLRGEQVFRGYARKVASLGIVMLLCLSTSSFIINADSNHGDCPLVPVVVVGTVYSDQGMTILPFVNIAIVINGILSDMTVADAAGQYLFNVDLNAGDAVLLYIDDSVNQGNTVYVSGGNDFIGANIYGAQTLLVRSQTGTAGNADLVNALGSHSDPDILYSYAGDDLVLAPGASFMTFGPFTFVASGSISATDDIEFGSSVVLTDNIILTAFDVTFNGNVDSDAAPRQLVINGNCNVYDVIGAINPLNIFDVSGSIFIQCPSISTIGYIIFGGATILSSHLSLTTMTSDIILNGDVDSLSTPRSLTVNGPGTCNINGMVGAIKPLASLTVGFSGTTVIDNNIYTTGYIDFGNPVILSSDIFLSASDVTFFDDVDSDIVPRGLTVVANGDCIIEGMVGGINALNYLTVSGPGLTYIDRDIYSISQIHFENPVILTGDVTLTGSFVIFDGTVDSLVFPKNLNVQGNCMVNDRIGGILPIQNFVVIGTTNIKDDIYSNGGQFYAMDVTFGDDCLLSAQGGITFQGMVNDDGGQYDLFLNAYNSDINILGDVGTVDSPAYIRIVSARNVMAGGLTSYYFSQESGTGTTNINNLVANFAYFKTFNVMGEVNVDQLWLDTNTAMVTGLVNGDPGPAGASAIGIIAPIGIGTHFFNLFDLGFYPMGSGPPTNPSWCKDTDGVLSDQWTSDNNPDFWWGGANHSSFFLKWYRFYWGPSSTGTSTNSTYSTSYDPPPLIGNQTMYLRVQACDATSQTAAWETMFIYKFDGTPSPELDLTLNYGWNLISFPLEQPKLNGTLIHRASDIFKITGCTELAIWNSTNQIYTVYIPGFNLPTDPENFFIGENDAVLVWWNESGDGTFLIEGYVPGAQTVSLKAGWNMVGYKCLGVQDMTLWADQVSCGLFDDICYYDPLDDTFRHYIFPGTEMELVPTMGYFIWSDMDTWLNY